MEDLVKELARDLRDVKQNTLELVKQGAVHNSLLKEHERRSIALEQLVHIEKNTTDSRIKNVEKTIDRVGFLAKIIAPVVVMILGALVGHLLK